MKGLHDLFHMRYVFSIALKNDLPLVVGLGTALRQRIEPLAVIVPAFKRHTEIIKDLLPIHPWADACEMVSTVFHGITGAGLEEMAHGFDRLIYRITVGEDIKAQQECGNSNNGKRCEEVPVLFEHKDGKGEI